MCIKSIRKIFSVAFILILLICSISGIKAQHAIEHINGKVIGVNDSGKKNPLIGANVYWLGTTTGSTTDVSGNFRIEKYPVYSKLVISYIGYRNDTIDVSNKEYINVELIASIELEEVEVVKRRKSTEISYLNPIKVETLGERELLKAACCNLSESFETSPSVDVSFTDAVTGARQIQMLGLAGPYTQITRENMPDVRGLSSVFGLTYTPGTWIESIQLNKGTGSAVNGYESITGQINVELQKPEKAERLYLNFYANEDGRIEGNLNLAHKFKDWSTGFLLHAKTNLLEHDRNNDGFLDHPMGNNLIAVNRWKYVGHQGLEAQLGIKITNIEKVGGQTGFDIKQGFEQTTFWGMQMKTQRIEGWAKIGKVYLNNHDKSMGFQISGINHVQESNFGQRSYDVEQQTLYVNYIYQNKIVNLRHKYRTGVSFQFDNYSEVLRDTTFEWMETVPGIYGEYTYSPTANFDVVAGLRGDYHNIYGTFITPRLHLRYAIMEKTVLRASAGRGQRTANIIAENIGVLSSSRTILINGNNSNKPYGLNPEVAWNVGVNLNQSFRFDYRDGNISFDFYRTQFENQIVVDYDANPQTVVFYNLEGESYSNSFQAQLDYELIKRLDVRLAYRWYDVKTTYGENLLDKPLLSKQRAFINLGYETRKHWKFDYTLNWQGQKRIPSTISNPSEYRLKSHSPDFFLMNAQISKVWFERLEVYVGMENILDYKQKNPILSSAQPFSNYFDSSLIWGPIFGRSTYLGLRFKIE